MSHRYRLTPTPEQEEILLGHCAHARFVWNLAVEQYSWRRPGRKGTPGYLEQCRQLTEARREFDWLRAGSTMIQQQALRDFAQEMTLVYAGTHRMAGYRKAGRDDGFRGVDLRHGRDLRRVSRHVGEVRIPKVGWVRFRWSRAVPEGAKSYRVTRDCAGRWHVSFAALQSSLERKPTGAVVGIDRGVRTALVTSDGQHYRAPRISDRRAARYLALQRRMARQHKGSAKREKTRRKMGRVVAAEKDRRKDWTEKVSTRLVRDYDVIAFEKLDIGRMTRRPKVKPDPAATGGFLPNGAARKAGLTRGILGSCWGLLARRCDHKGTASGVAVVYVNPYRSSQECRECGHVAAESRESQAVFRCVNCGHTDHADVNAARNVLARGLALTGVSAHAPGHGVSGPQKPAKAAAGTARIAA